MITTSRSMIYWKSHEDNNNNAGKKITDFPFWKKQL